VSDADEAVGEDVGKEAAGELLTAEREGLDLIPVRQVFIEARLKRPSSGVPSQSRAASGC
jgi:hypothetical protein